MRELRKYRWKSKYFIVCLISYTILLFVSCLFIGGFWEIITRDYMMAEKERGALQRGALLLKQSLCWENIILGGMYYMPLIFPVFASFPVLQFREERRQFLLNSVLRYPSMKRYQLKACLTYAIQGGLVVSVGLFIYISVLAPFLIPTIQNIGGYSSIFPSTFYFNHPYLFFVFMGFTIYFAFGFVFGLLACALCVWKDNVINILITPLIIYTVLNYISAQFHGCIPIWLSACVCAFNTTLTFGETFIPLVPILVFSIIFLYAGLKIKARRGLV